MEFLWIIQDSKGQHYNWIELAKSIDNVGSRYVFFDKEKLNKFQIYNEYYPIIIGGDDFIEAARKNTKLDRGIFSSEAFFRVDSYAKKWGNEYLNHDVRFVSYDELLFMDNKRFFIRPILDNKCFDGHIIEKKQTIEKIVAKCEGCKYRKTRCICISPVKSIKKEWRAVIINEIPVTICRYLNDGKREVSQTDVPSSLREFCVKKSSNCNAPVAWIMDVAEVENMYFVLECNIFNASNFYDCNREKIVCSLERPLLRNCK